MDYSKDEGLYKFKNAKKNTCYKARDNEKFKKLLETDMVFYKLGDIKMGWVTKGKMFTKLFKMPKKDFEIKLNDYMKNEDPKEELKIIVILFQNIKKEKEKRQQLLFFSEDNDMKSTIE